MNGDNINFTRPQKSRQKMLRKRERNKKYQNHLYALSKIYYSPVFMLEYHWGNGKRIPISKPYLKRYSDNPRRKKFYKRQANKSVRRHHENIGSGKAYRKIYDYIWKVY